MATAAASSAELAADPKFWSAKQLATKRAQKLKLSAADYSQVMQTHETEYESDFHENIDDEDAFVAAFDRATKQLQLIAPPSALHAAPLLTDFALDDLAKVKLAWEDLHHTHGRRGLAKALVKGDIDARLGAENGMSPDETWAFQAMFGVLLSMDDTLIKSIMCGNLSTDKRLDRRLAQELAKIREQSKRQPCIYHQSLVDKNGMSPSPNELLQMLVYMEKYMKACSQVDDPAETRDIDVLPFDRETMCELDAWKSSVGTEFDASWANKVDFAKYMWRVVEVPVSTDAVPIVSDAVKSKGKIETEIPSSISGFDASDTDSSATRQKAKTENEPAKVEWRYSEAHVIETKAFVTALRDRLSKVDDGDMDKPLQFHLSKLGMPKSPSSA
ncbi:hypothetical protein C7974DRAFT_384413 [Boeremia exigua]|uniref:uncharacterized protein n=1 Tax=Boeremia exigua TaxID=749465 RepID=UPI001E8EBAE4|nr:uncharacterized protein C7974DRAFT_384413 [Boeremia exigua]KAH6644863.1 hypothetical protein C7974DRAFT_384413 [Boeremia exigua]